jgi:hypothetical protein
MPTYDIQINDRQRQLIQQACKDAAQSADTNKTSDHDTSDQEELNLLALMLEKYDLETNATGLMDTSTGALNGLAL